MTISSISAFLQSISVISLTVFNQRLTQTDWQILLALGRMCGSNLTDTTHLDPQSGQSYKSLKFACSLSDDTLSRALRRLVEMGLVERHTTELDQRVVRYSLSAKGEQGFTQMARLVVAELGSLILSLSAFMPESNAKHLNPEDLRKNEA